MIKRTLAKAGSAITQLAEDLLPSNRLSGQDALFLHIDQPHVQTHGSLIYIYDQSTVPSQKLRFQDLRRHVEQRLSHSPLFRNKIQRVVGDLGYPYWVEDPEFDIDFHLRHFALPKPCDWRQFCILTSRIHGRSMDMNRPLWEMYVIEGLDNVEGFPKGSFAIMTKLHHAAVDGTALAELTWALHDTLAARNGKGVKAMAAPREADTLASYQADSKVSQTLLRIATDNLMSVTNLLPPVSRVAPRLGGMATRALRDRLLPEDGKTAPGKLARTRFNSKFDHKRVFESVQFSLDEIKTIRAAAPGATVNDVVLSVVGGALRRYLAAKKELPKTTLTAMAPVNTRTDASERKTTGNAVSALVVPLGTHIGDPVKRLQAVHAATTRSKEVSNAIGARDLTDISKFTPPATLALVGRMFNTVVGGSPKFHCIVSNVPGPTEPLFMRGAKLLYWSGVMPIPEGAGLFFAVSSYCGKLFVSPTSAPSIVPDPEFLAECLRVAFAETLAAAQAAGTPKTAAPARKKATAKRKAAAPVGTAATPVQITA